MLIRNLRTIIITLLVSLATISYHPFFFNSLLGNSSVSERSVISRYMSFTAIVAFLLTINVFDVWKCSKTKNIFIVLILCYLQALLLAAFFNINTCLYEVNNVMIAVSFMIIGYCSRISIRQFSFITLLYVVLSTFVLYSQVRTNIGGFVILDQYLANAKNALGVVGTAACITAFYFAVCNVIKKAYIKYFLIGLSIFLIILLLTIRARSSVFILLCVLLIFLYTRVRSNHGSFIIILLLLSLIFIFVDALGGVNVAVEYIYSSLFQNRETDFSSDRVNRDAEALEIFFNSPFFGQITYDKEIAWVHNYFLRILSSYGLIGGFFLIYLYLYFVVINIKMLLKSGFSEIRYIGFVIIMSPLISSLVEPTFPYSPGSATVFAFICFGYSLRHYNTSNNLIIKSDK